MLVLAVALRPCLRVFVGLGPCPRVPFCSFCPERVVWGCGRNAGPAWGSEFRSGLPMSILQNQDVTYLGGLSRNDRCCWLRWPAFQERTRKA